MSTLGAMKYNDITALAWINSRFQIKKMIIFNVKLI